jgi:hypothetical protein
VSGSHFNPRNIQDIPPVKIFGFLALEQDGAFFKGLLWWDASPVRQCANGSVILDGFAKNSISTVSSNVQDKDLQILRNEALLSCAAVTKDAT